MPVVQKPDISAHKDLFLYRLRHSASHIMAQAVVELFPDVKLGIGPPIEDGFYYDFDTPHTFTPDDLARIEEKMRNIIAEDAAFVREEKSREEAVRLLQDRNERYKLEILSDIPADEPVTFYTSGRFTDLCEGPHVEHTGEVRHFKLLKVSGAYWRGVETNPMLQRIYGTAFETEEELRAYLRRVEEAEKRDHRKLGAELGLFGFFEEAGAGLAFYYPKGATLLRQLEEWMYGEHLRRGYEPLRTPHMLKTDFWKLSGHLDHYRDAMFFIKDMEGGSADAPIPGISYGVKPMNCPGHVLVYRSQTRSYRDLPIRYFEFGTVYRDERGGTMRGLLRVRGFTQDDAHIFCTPEQYEEEVSACLDFCFHTLDTFGFDYYVGLKTRPDDKLGSDEIWDMAEGGLEKVLKDRGVPFFYGHKDATFYGPKVDFIVRDSLGRDWQGSTVQLDFNLPERFGMEYVDAHGEARRPVMIHRAILGSFERFIGLLVEEFNGAFPLWLAPVQVRVLPLTDELNDYAAGVRGQLQEAGFRVELDDRSEKLGKKIRDGTVQKIPYLVVIGKREAESGKVAVRSYFDGDLGAMELSQLSARMKDEVERKLARRKD
ncbi:MAG: threonine--tRNA ligase [Planctomycetales bacterium 4484_113]|nr:MAG: threonine--tRNA ligase [Planctomycetales bacterium 4484_113]